jgi:hypothetical protein
MILCPPAEIFNFRLDLAGTENPPAWARDENGELKPGWGCSGLGDTDSGYQKVVGSTVLHEMFHCLSIFDGVANYDNFIYDGRYYGQNNQIHMIKDFPLDYRSCMSLSRWKGWLGDTAPVITQQFMLTKSYRRTMEGGEPQPAASGREHGHVPIDPEC